MTTPRTFRVSAAIAATALLTALVPAVPAYAGGGLFVTIGLTDPSGGAASISATLWDFDGQPVSTVNGQGGSGAILLFPDVPAGKYWVSAQASNGPVVWAREFMGGAFWGDDSIPVEIFPDAAFPAPETITLERAGSVTGTVDAPVTDTDDASLEAYRWDGETYRFLARTETFGTGQFSLGGLPAGDYRVRTVSDDVDVQPEWWQNSLTQAGGTTLAVASNSTQQILPVLGGEREFAFSRLAGSNRYETSALVSQQLFPTSAPVAIPVLYIANGTNYPDALSAGPAASHLGGGLLLVQSTTIPAVVLAEIDRLNPGRIVIVGGETSVSSAVATQLATFAPVDRMAGSNRYETSRLIVADAFECTDECPQTVFIATGANFPDALSAGPAAAKNGAPLLLVSGAQGSLDGPTSAVLDTLDPLKVVVVGNTGSVSSGIENDLTSAGIFVKRFAGSNRYETANLLNAATFDGSTERAYVASGAGFADALAGGPLAAAFDAPMILTPKACGTVANYDLIYKLGVLDIVYLGGLSSVGDVVLNRDCS